jgi:hypothetical protein
VTILVGWQKSSHLSSTVPSFIYQSRLVAMTDRASRALVESDLPGEPRTYDAISKRSNVPISTLNHRALGRRSIEAKARGQLYLKPLEEEALVKHLILEANFGNPVPIKFLASLAFIIARQRSTTNDEVNKPLNKNWA